MSSKVVVMCLCVHQKKLAQTEIAPTGTQAQQIDNCHYVNYDLFDGD